MTSKPSTRPQADWQLQDAGSEFRIFDRNGEPIGTIYPAKGALKIQFKVRWDGDAADISNDEFLDLAHDRFAADLGAEWERRGVEFLDEGKVRTVPDADQSTKCCTIPGSYNIVDLPDFFRLLPHLQAGALRMSIGPREVPNVL